MTPAKRAHPTRLFYSLLLLLAFTCFSNPLSASVEDTSKATKKTAMDTIPFKLTTDTLVVKKRFWHLFHQLSIDQINLFDPY